MESPIRNHKCPPSKWEILIEKSKKLEYRDISDIAHEYASWTLDTNGIPSVSGDIHTDIAIAFETGRIWERMQDK